MFFVSLAVIVSSYTHAELVETDWKTAGDGLVTVDTVSGLEWLDLTASVNYDYNYVLGSFSSPFGTFNDGWRYASSAEVDTFFRNAGVFGYVDAPYIDNTDPTFVTNANILLDLIGITYTDANTIRAEGYTKDAAPQTQSRISQYMHVKSGPTYVVVGLASRRETVESPAWGSWLVRTTTYVPPSPVDSDDDGLPDTIEDNNGNGVVDVGETDPLNPDSDSDGALDGVEDTNGNGYVDASETDPLNPDSDGDGLTDGYEINIGETDPNVSTMVYTLQCDMNGDEIVNLGDLLLLQRQILGY
jgi:hypothetical protein